MLNVLVIEDNLDHFLLIEDALLAGHDNEVNIDHHKLFEYGVQALNSRDYDICLCDLKLPDSSIEQSIQKLKSMRTKTPIIVLTSLNSLTVAKDLLKHNIQDYLPKEELSPTLLNRMCAYAIERKNQQLQLERRNTDMQTFCASLSHDFKGHIRRIARLGDLIRSKLSERYEINEDENKWFYLLESNTLNLANLVDDLGRFLTVEHDEAPMDYVDLNDIIAQLQTQIRDSVDRNFQLVVLTTLPIVIGNASQLSILFYNLITNAIKYNERDPIIELSFEADTTNNCGIIHVKDNGIGIDSNYFSNIFDPFRRAHSNKDIPGSGLGLSIVRRIVERHQGAISVASSTQTGSTFSVTLPLKNSDL